MTRLPAPVAVQHLLDSLRKLGEPTEKGRPLRIDELERDLLGAIERDQTGYPTLDGYAAGVGGGRAGGRTIAVDDEAGRPDAVPVTSVEGTVLDRLEPDNPRRMRDHHHDLTAKAVRAVSAAVVAIQTAFGALASIDDLVDTAPPAPKTCDHCTDKRGLGGNRRIYVRGTVGDRLGHAVSLCEPCYEFVRQVALPGTRLGYLPSDVQILEHEQRGRWRIRLTPSRKAS